MKRKFLILSAAVLTVCGAALLQSCSSEYEYYDATEEYGYYTEEEIATIEAMAKMYGLSIEFNKDYYGPKKSLYKHEEEMIGLSSLLGEYELVPIKTDESRIVYKTKRREMINSRISTRAIESNGKWSGTQDKDDFSISVEISWNGDGTLQGQSASGTVSISKRTNTDLEHDSTGSLTCSCHGDSGIRFSGWVKYRETTSIDNKTQKKYFTEYSFNIDGGEVSTTTPPGGTFVVSGGSSKKFTEDL